MTHQHPFEHHPPRSTCQASESWWIELGPQAFTATVEREQLPRMRLSRFSSMLGKPYTTDEVSR